MADLITIRAASPMDAEALRSIYSPYVERTAITFEYEVPTTAEFADRIRRTLLRYPYLIAEMDKTVVGYAYAGRFHEREAYDWSVEISLYVAQDRQRQGIGGRLHQALEDALRKQGILNLNACIAYLQQEDEYLTKNSAEFHAHLGYRMVGEFRQCGCKFGRWYNMVWMEKHIGPHLPNPPHPQPYAGETGQENKEKTEE